MGLVDLDRLMAGGMPLGSVTLLLEVGDAGGGHPGGGRGLCTAFSWGLGVEHRLTEEKGKRTAACSGCVSDVR